MQKTGCDINDDDEHLYAGTTTVAAAMTLTDPADPLNVWVIGINVYDSPIVIMTPGSTEVYETHANSNLVLCLKSFARYFQFKAPRLNDPKFVLISLYERIFDRSTPGAFNLKISSKTFVTEY